MVPNPEFKGEWKARRIPREGAADAMQALVAPLAQEFGDELVFLVHDANKSVPQHMGFGARECGAGRVFAIAVPGELTPHSPSPKWLFPTDTATGATTTSQLREWIGKWKRKEAAQFVRSAEEPQTPNKPGEVAVVVGTTFDDIVMDPGKDVFVEFYAPWCDKCKALAPKYDALAKNFADDANVVIAKVDLVANQPGSASALFPVEGVPTLFLATAAEGVPPKLFDGERETDAMLEWIQTNRATSVVAA